ncbi:monovalent cation/H(+) antiporter subunit G [Actinomadura sp. NPDC047616]|uniref:monovalent cation/H(+) antiporter subunit G n=1 Tax=Actinomadura sp. NPDC047616 TaxID=3155914 RepID=UPI0033F4AF22
MTAATAGTALAWAGTVLAVACALRLPLTRDAATRLHVVAPVTTVAAPLVLAGLALRPWSSWHDVAKLLLIAVLLTGTGPAAVATAGQAVHRATRPHPQPHPQPGPGSGGGRAGRRSEGER